MVRSFLRDASETHHERKKKSPFFGISTRTLILRLVFRALKVQNLESGILSKIEAFMLNSRYLVHEITKKNKNVSIDMRRA